MPRAAAVKTGAHVLLRPEDAPAALREPTYGTVTAVGGRAAVAIVDGARTVSISVPMATIRERVVSQAEATGHKTGLLLRSAVAVALQGRWAYGQVIGYSGDKVSVALSGVTVSIPSQDIVRTDPIVALLLRQFAPPISAWTAERLMEAHAVILARTLGSTEASITPSSDIATILNGIVPREQAPPSATLCAWVDPATGEPALFGLQHAVDFVFAIEGGNEISIALRGRLGQSFCREPLPPSSRASANERDATGRGSQTVAETRSLRSSSHVSRSPTLPQVNISVGSTRAAVANSAPTTVDNSVLHAVANSAPTTVANSVLHAVANSAPTTVANSVPNAVANSAPRIVVNSMPNPPSVRPSAPRRRATRSSPQSAASFFASDGSDASGVSDVEERTEGELHAHALLADRDALLGNVPARRRRESHRSPSPDRSSKRPKTDFLPTKEERQVHAVISRNIPRGTSAHAEVDSLLTHPSLEFLPDPGTLIRLYDFSFGVRGLSIMHFNPMKERDQARIMEGINTRNLSSSAAPPKPYVPIDIACVVLSVTSFHTYTTTFCDDITVSLASRLLAFVNTFRRSFEWEPEDLEELVRWINRGLQSYRKAIVDDIAQGTQSRTQTALEFSTSSAGFTSLMSKISADKLARLIAYQKKPVYEASRREHEQAHSHRDRNDRNDRGRSTKKASLPADARPSLQIGNKTICLRWLSNKGCQGLPSDPNACSYDSRVHVVPKFLHPGARKFITENLNGLKPDPRTASSSVQLVLEDRLRTAEELGTDRLCSALAAIGITYAPHGHQPGKAVDVDLVLALSALTRARKFSLAELVRVYRNETQADPRPNKALCIDTYELLLHDFEQRDLLITIAKEGVRPVWSRPLAAQEQAPANHKSAELYAGSVTRSIAKGQSRHEYLLLDATLREALELHVSPFGAVEKTGYDPFEVIRLIHDLSFPRGTSVNDMCVSSLFPPISQGPVTLIARRIEALHAVRLRRGLPNLRILILKGDVASAFRHLRLHSGHVKWMCGTLGPGRSVVIDLAAPFGWCGSPAYYAVFGKAISFLVSRESPASMSPPAPDTTCFWGYEWVDDHVMVELDDGERCTTAEEALRLAMLAVLGPRAINNDKFSSWCAELKVLGLDWDTVALTVSMPVEKIQKASHRVAAARAAQRLSRRDLEELLGSLRHVALCVPATKPFFQNLHQLLRQVSRYSKISLDADARRDLDWLSTIYSVGNLRGIPLSFFGLLPAPRAHFYMDASDSGIAVLDPATKRFCLIDFTTEERALFRLADASEQLSINVREHFAIAIAAGVLAVPRSHTVSKFIHVRCWTDNMAAASWTNSRQASSAFGRELNRFIGLLEAVFSIRVSAAHVPGARPNIDPAHLHQLLHHLQSRALATSSASTYDRSWRQWTTWCRRWNLRRFLPRGESASLQLALFALYCWYELGNRASTVLSKLSHVSWYHRARRGYDVTIHAGHQLALQGMRRLSPAAQGRLPVSYRHLLAARSLLNFDSHHDRVLWGATVMGFFFLLRRSEYTATNGRTAWFIIRRRDVEFLDDAGVPTNDIPTASTVSITFRGSKTDQLGKSTTRRLTRSGDTRLCPVRAVAALARLHDKTSLSKDTPLCLLDRAGATLSSNSVTKLLKRAAKSLGEDPTRYSSHSLRAGGATALFASGAHDTTIQQHGRWQSDTFRLYTRIENATLSSMAGDMVSADRNH